jgi:hypothetical protein
MTDSETTDTLTEQKEAHRLGTINRWDPPEGDWAAEYDWTRYRGPDPWPVPGGWLFKDPEDGGWWQFFGDAGVGHWDSHDLLDELKDDPSVEDASAALDEHRGEYAYLHVETANPDEVSIRNPEDEKLEWTLEVADLATLFVGSKPWVRVVDGELQALRTTREVREEGDQPVVSFGVEEADVDREWFADVVGAHDDLPDDEYPNLAKLKPADETPFRDWDELPDGQHTFTDLQEGSDAE